MTTLQFLIAASAIAPQLMTNDSKLKPHIWLIRVTGVIVPRRLRADWRQEWEAELLHREELLAVWDRLNRRNKLILLRRSLGAFRDAMLLQPRRLEDEMFQDMRFGVRMMLKHKILTIVAVLSLALGIGANTAIFSLIDALLLKMLPVAEPQRLALFTIAGQRSEDSFWYPLYQQFRDRNRTFSGVIAATGARRMRMTMSESKVGARVESARGQMVSGNFFSVLGAPAALGRTLIEDDDRAGNQQAVAVISYGFWQRRFGGDPAAVGKRITLDDTPFTIIGVAPPKFFGFEVGGNADLWFSLRMAGDQALSNRYGSWMQVMGRLRPEANATQARAEMDVIFQQELAQVAEGYETRSGPKWTEVERRDFLNRHIELQPGGAGWTPLRDMFKKPLFILMTLVGLAQLIACANVANLLLARAVARRKEIAVRLAIGAGRFRLMRQLLTESMLLTFSGAALGLLFAQWSAHLLLSFLPQYNGPIRIDLALNTRVLGFTLAVSLLTGLLAGIAPALRATRLDLASSLKEQASDSKGGRTRLPLNKILVVAQVALSLFLLVGGGLFTRSLQNLKNLDAGFDRENVTLFELDLGSDYPTPRRVTLYKQLLERLEGLPGARAASFSSYSLLSGTSQSMKVSVEGYTPPPDDDMFCKQLWVTPQYFATMGIPLLRGRDFGPQDELPASGPAASVAKRPLVTVINQTMARQFFGDENPIGKRIRFPGYPDKNSEPFEIVGVVKDAKFLTLREKAPRITYFPFLQMPNDFGSTFQLRAVSDPAGLAAAIRRMVQEIDPKVQTLDLRTMNDVVNESLAQERFVAQLAGFFSLFALLLACIGLYGVMSYTVTRRTREIGVRMALGAQGGDVLRMVLRETMLLVLSGLAIGLAAALATTKLVESLLSDLLFGLAATDPLTIALAALLLFAVAALAGWLPARRAARVDPLVALRHE
ncbi:MAG TPA: ABC transporter permease [Blastocatellia bacterium]|nr:ABC transporter permease [Blastocatellia bacterium]